MKKIYLIMALALASFTFTGCDDDDTVVYDVTANNLPVLSQETSFGAMRSTGNIVVDTNEPVTVTSNAGEWLTTSVSGNTITVTAEQNNSLEGRAATLTISAGQKTTDISVIQSGAVFSMGGVTYILANDNAQTFSYPVKCNLPVNFYTEDDFYTLDYDEENSTLTVKFTANKTGHARPGVIYYSCGTIEDEIAVCQVEFAKDIAGDYQLRFYKSDGKLVYVNATLNKTGSNYFLDIPANNFSIPVSFDPNTLCLTIAAGQKCGEYTYQGKTYDVVTILHDTEAGYLTWSTAATMEAWFEGFYLEDGTFVTLAEFEDSGSWGTYEATSLRLELFTGTPYGSSTRAGLSVYSMIYPFLYRFDVPESAQTLRLMPGRKKVNVAPAAELAPVAVPTVCNDDIKIAY